MMLSCSTGCTIYLLGLVLLVPLALVLLLFRRRRPSLRVLVLLCAVCVYAHRENSPPTVQKHKTLQRSTSKLPSNVFSPRVQKKKGGGTPPSGASIELKISIGALICLNIVSTALLECSWLDKVHDPWISATTINIITIPTPRPQ